MVAGRDVGRDAGRPADPHDATITYPGGLRARWRWGGSGQAAAVFARFDSRLDDSPAMKAVAALRNQFGGHAVTAADRGTGSGG